MKNKKLSASQAKSAKAEVIVHVLDYIDNKDEKAKKSAIEKLTAYAKFYNLSPRKNLNTPKVKQHLREFILNKKGYMNTIPNLFNSLHNS